MKKTFSPRPADIKRDWFVVDANEVVLGRLAVELARRLRGKHKPEFAPHVDAGDYIVVINAGKVRVTGRKEEQKHYFRHSGYPGGIYQSDLGKLRQRYPQRIIHKAVRGMLPKGPLGYAMLKKLKIYAGAEHPHQAQQPKALRV
jgi:large subunit ribosomal protein L13